MLRIPNPLNDVNNELQDTSPFQIMLRLFLDRYFCIKYTTDEHVLPDIVWQLEPWAIGRWEALTDRFGGLYYFITSFLPFILPFTLWFFEEQGNTTQHFPPQKTTQYIHFLSLSKTQKNTSPLIQIPPSAPRKSLDFIKKLRLFYFSKKGLTTILTTTRYLASASPL